MTFDRITWKILIAGALFSIGILLFISFGPPKLMARTESVAFCSSCHVMQSQFEAWFNVGAHRSIRCVECHLPNENIYFHYLWKSIDGIKDLVVFYSGRIPEKMRLSMRGKSVIQSNCIRCHSERVAKIIMERRCWDCHRFLQHSLAGVRHTN